MEVLTTETLNSLMGLLPALLVAWGQLVLLSMPLCLFFASAMLPFVVICGLVLARFGRKSLYERSARQLAGLGNILNWLFLGCAAAGFLVARPQLEAMHGLYLLGTWLLLGLLTTGTLLWTVVATAWKPLRKLPSLHGILAFLAGSCLAAVPLGGLLASRLVFQNSTLPVQEEWRAIVELVPLLLPTLSDPFWLLTGLLHFFEAAAAGGVGLIWLIFRRHVDDFGRDYYVFAANWCGEWGTYGGWISLIATGGLIGFSLSRDPLLFSNAPTLMFIAGALIPLLIAAILWTTIARSTNPMRHKVGMVFALLLYIGSIASGGALIVF